MDQDQCLEDKIFDLEHEIKDREDEIVENERELQSKDRKIDKLKEEHLSLWRDIYFHVDSGSLFGSILGGTFLVGPIIFLLLNATNLMDGEITAFLAGSLGASVGTYSFHRALKAYLDDKLKELHTKNRML